MGDFFIAIYALFAIWLLGLNFMLATGLRRKEIPLPGNMATEFALGAGLLYLILFTLSIVTGQLVPSSIYVFLLLLILFNLFYKKRFPFTKNLLPKRWEMAGVLIIICLFALLFIPSLHKGLEWDAWAIWAFKAKAFYVDGKINNHFLTDFERYAYSHPDYPLLIPLLEYWIYFHLGHINDHVIRLVPLSFWLCVLSFFYSTALKYIKPSAALLSLSVLSFTWPMTINSLMSSADTIQAFYNLAGIIYLYKWIEKNEKAYFFSGTIILALGMNVKNEGLAFWASAALALLLLSAFRTIRDRSTKHLYSFSLFALTGIVISAMWIIKKKVNTIGSELFSKGVPPMETIIERSGELFLYYLKQIINTGFPGWGLLWIFTAWALFKLIACGGLRKESKQLYIATCFFHMLALFAIYCITPYEFSYHIQTSGDRTLLQVVPAIFWMGVVTLFEEENREEGPNHSP